MHNLNISGIPKELFLKLEKTAKRKHRTIAEQALISLELGLDSVTQRKEKRKNALKKLAQLSKYNAKKFSDPVAMVREDRER